MAKGSGTRSGLLWEVERLLKECKELPQVLLMENVPNVHNKHNVDDFNDWINFLESLGYTNYWKDLNAKDYGIPQTRNRCFMVSFLGNYKYNFPKPVELKLRLKDFLESEVDEKYYLSERMKKYIVTDNDKWINTTGKSLVNKELASTINTCEGQRRCDASNYVCDNFKKETDLKEYIPSLNIKEATKKGYTTAYEGDGVYTNRPNQKRGVVQHGMIQTITTAQDCIGVVVKNKDKLPFITQNKRIKNLVNEANLSEDKTIFLDVYNQRIREEECGTLTSGMNHQQGNLIYNELRIRKLTPKECFRLMGFDDEDFKKCKAAGLSDTRLYKQAGNSIVVDVLEAIFKEMLYEE